MVWGGPLGERGRPTLFGGTFWRSFWGLETGRAAAGAASRDSAGLAKMAAQRTRFGTRVNALTSQTLPARGFPGEVPGQARAIVPEMLADLVKLADATTVLAAALLASLLAASGITSPIAPLDRYAFVTILAAMLLVAIAGRGGGYALARLAEWRGQVVQASLAWGGTLALLLGLGFLIKDTSVFSRAWMLVWTASCLGLLLAQRSFVAWRIAGWTRAGRFRRTVAIVGPRAEALAAALGENGSLAIVGLFDDGGPRPGLSGTPANLLALARGMRLDEIILAVPLDQGALLARLVARLRELPVDLRLALPSLDPSLAGGPADGAHGGIPMLDLVERPLKRWSAAVKRTEDCVLGAVLLVLAAPVMAVVALAVLVTSGRPVLFVQDRFGFNNRRIRVLKFRTMRAGTDPSGARPTAARDPRVTRFGRLLRSWSLDELPQLVNVLRGDMSLVGPRPHAVAMEVGGSRYEEAVGGYFRRHRVRPGMTGLAQVRGLRGELAGAADAERRLRADLDYIEQWSLGLDLGILLRTVGLVLSRRNAG